MALKSAASRRYALALIESAGSAKDTTLERTLEELTTFARLVESSFDLRNSLLNPVFTATERRQVMAAVLAATQMSSTMGRFVELLIARDRVREIGEIAEAYQMLADERRGRVRAEVETAAPLSPEATDRLRRTLEKATGRTIELDVQVDPALIGGLRARVGSMLFDGTIRSELDRLRQSLLHTD